MTNRFDEAKASARQTGRRARREAAKAASRANDQTNGRLSEAVQKTSDAVKRTDSSTRRAMARAIKHTRGTAIGDRAVTGAKKMVGEMARAPLLTLPADAIGARQGIDELVELHAASPFDPRRSIWLAEGLLRARHGRNKFKLGRTMVNPWTVVVRGVVTALYEDETDAETVPVVSQLLAMAYVLALAGLDEQVNSPDLHSLSRVYLARGAADEAVRLAQGALTLESAESGDAAFTLALAHRRRGADALAISAAEFAIDEGTSLGYNVLVDLGHRRGGGSIDAACEADYRSRVERTDVERYGGVALSAGDIAKKVSGNQWDRTTGQFNRANSWLTEKRKNG